MHLCKITQNNIRKKLKINSLDSLSWESLHLGIFPFVQCGSCSSVDAIFSFLDSVPYLSLFLFNLLSELFSIFFNLICPSSPLMWCPVTLRLRISSNCRVPEWFSLHMNIIFSNRALVDGWLQLLVFYFHFGNIVCHLVDSPSQPFVNFFGTPRCCDFVFNLSLTLNLEFVETFLNIFSLGSKMIHLMYKHISLGEKLFDSSHLIVHLLQSLFEHLDLVLCLLQGLVPSG